MNGDDEGKGLLWKLPLLKSKQLGKLGPGFGLGAGCGFGLGFGLVGGAGIGPGMPGLQLGFGFGVGCGVGLGFGYGAGRGIAYDENRRYSNVGKLFNGPGNIPSRNEIGALFDELVINTKKLIKATSTEPLSVYRKCWETLSTSRVPRGRLRLHRAHPPSRPSPFSPGRRLHRLPNLSLLPSPQPTEELAKWYGPDRRIFLPEGLLDRSEIPEYLTGEVPGDYGYDPFGLSKNPENFSKYQAYELIHARWAMLGAAGFIIPEAFNKFGANCGPEAVWFKTGALLLDGNTLNYFGKNIPINLIVAVVAEVVLLGGAEYYRIINGLVCENLEYSSSYLLSLVS
ncbi:hypothetical protein F0562_011725 [Nyssa sinensis]|uniref:Chlorophyll a-b binding protein, chloroplastic n=1 Tax=Nyssa sinensis TaxID=561372 RepID=A0A5J4ZUR0_9ASTE|nr:hypothetical protein F0562_011725 [Nyssa sinensis]